MEHITTTQRLSNSKQETNGGYRMNFDGLIVEESFQQHGRNTA